MAIDVSIIIPTYNRDLKGTLNSIKAQTYPKSNFEILIVDDGSETSASHLIKEYLGYGLNIIYLRQKRRGPAQARNLGLEKSRGEIICFTDDDCILASDWIEKIFHLHKDNPQVLALGGETRVKRNILKNIVSQFMANGAMYTKTPQGKKLIFFPTSNVSLKKRLLGQYKFDSRIPYAGGEDLEFFWNLYLKGEKFLYSQEVQVLHQRKHSFINFIMQPYIYGKGNFWVQRKHLNHPALLELKNTAKLLKAFLEIPFFSVYIACSIAQKYNMQLKEKQLLFFYLIIYRIMYFCGYLVEKFNYCLK